MGGTEKGASEASSTHFLIRGDASPEEVAALTAVLTALASGAGEPERPARSVWASPQRAVRRPHAHGRGAWRSSGLPR
ncbi:acyl-CoA carboxylase subunit epsilon [Nocardioides massiliensis]|uniref:Acyl-CoA carboxylase subunit epsilon n=1 Tax=Nocardioides massiliensis TaxID=1325935 RepID=A0ABT9NUX0_9ACTN|nr:acyl-CoA carboxylase subunit epsilon [Nocardioides massiliensis]MDP9824224.1 hypothetical protein [Nocardioides massiliensis]